MTPSQNETAATLSERAERARWFAWHLDPFDEGRHRLLEFATELETRAALETLGASPRADREAL